VSSKQITWKSCDDIDHIGTSGILFWTLEGFDLVGKFLDLEISMM